MNQATDEILSKNSSRLVELITSLKFRIVLIVLPGIIILSFVLIQTGFQTARSKMIEEKAAQMRETTLELLEEVLKENSTDQVARLYIEKTRHFV